MNRKRQNRPLVIWGCITILLMLCFLVRILMPNRSYELSGTYELAAGESAMPYDALQLSPGMYKVELRFAADTESLASVAYVTVQDPTVRGAALLTNGESLYAGMEASGFHFWLYERADALQLQVEAGEVCGLTLTGCTVTETDGLWTRLLTLTLCVSTVGFAILLWRGRMRQGNSIEENRGVFFWLCVIILLAVMPYLYGENTLGGIDVTYHMRRIEGLATGLRSGQIPLRIEPEWLYARGYASAIFYCDLLLYFPAVLRLLGFTVTESYNAYCIAITVLTTVVAYACFRRIFRDCGIGCLCSALYTLSVFRIYKLLNTCDVGEGSAVAFLPLIVYGFYRVFTEEPKQRTYRTAWIPLAIGYAGVLQTHMLTSLITAGLTALVILACAKKVFEWSTFRQLLQGALGAVGLSAWFLVPFLDYYLTQDIHVRHLAERRIQDAGLTLAHLGFQFWGSGGYTPSALTGVYHTYPVGVGFILLLGLGCCCVLLVRGRLKQCGIAIRRMAVLSAGLAILLLWMSTRYFPWDAISEWNKLTSSVNTSLQFPNRFLGWATVLLTVLCGVWYGWCKIRSRRNYVWSVAVTVICLLTSSVWLMEVSMTQGQTYAIYNDEGMGFGYIGGEEYLPEGTDASLLSFSDHAIAGETVEIFNYSKDYLTAELTCANVGEQESYVEVPLTWYRGYAATDLDTGEQFTVLAGDNNVVRVLLPAGYSGSLKIRYVTPWYWRAAEIISLMTIVGMIGYGLRQWRKKLSAAKREPSAL